MVHLRTVCALIAAKRRAFLGSTRARVHPLQPSTNSEKLSDRICTISPMCPRVCGMVRTAYPQPCKRSTSAVSSSPECWPHMYALAFAKLHLHRFVFVGESRGAR